MNSVQFKKTKKQGIYSIKSNFDYDTPIKWEKRKYNSTIFQISSIGIVIQQVLRKWNYQNWELQILNSILCIVIRHRDMKLLLWEIMFKPEWESEWERARARARARASEILHINPYNA